MRNAKCAYREFNLIIRIPKSGVGIDVDDRVLLERELYQAIRGSGDPMSFKDFKAFLFDHFALTVAGKCGVKKLPKGITISFRKKPKGFVAGVPSY